MEDLPQDLEKEAVKEERDSILASVSGMSCGHCVGRVTQALEKTGDFEDVQVSLNPGSAFVLIKNGIAREKAEADLLKAVEEAGYQAEITDRLPEKKSDAKMQARPLTIAPLQPKKADQPASSEVPLWTGVLPVEGMSCAHCQGRVQKALEALPGVQSVSVSLEKKEAVIQAEKPVPVQEAVRAVEEAGYEPGKNYTEEEQKVSTETEGEKIMKKELKVEGMSCNHCRQAVINALSKVDGVTLADVDLGTKTAWVASAGPIDDNALIKAVEDAGYKVTEIH